LFGDPLPPDAIARLGTVRWRLDGHHAESMAATPDGKTLVAVHAAKGITIFDTVTGKVFRQIPEKAEMRKEWLGRDDLWSVSAVSGDGRTAALIPAGGHIHIIDLAIGKARLTLKANRGQILRAVLSGDGNILATLALAGQVDVWDAKQGKLVRELTTDRKQVPLQWRRLGPTITADGKTLAWVGPGASLDVVPAKLSAEVHVFPVLSCVCGCSKHTRIPDDADGAFPVKLLHAAHVIRIAVGADKHVDLLRPPVEIFHGIGIDRLVEAAVGPAMSLAVAGQVDSAGGDSAGHRRFPDGAPGGTTMGRSWWSPCWRRRRSHRPDYVVYGSLQLQHRVRAVPTL